MRRIHLLLVLSMLGSVGGSCASGGVSSRDTESPPVVAATFTTMGNMIVAPGRTSTCPAWFWEQWSLSIRANGEAHVEVSDGKKLVYARDHVLSKRKLGNLIAFLESEMTKGSAEVGAAATDSDYGEIVLSTERSKLKLTAQGAGEVDPEFGHFYRIIRHLEWHLHIPNPYCR